MIRTIAFALLLLYTSINGVDAAHAWSHIVEAAHEDGHDHDHDSCALCDWESVVVPEPVDPIEVPSFVAFCMPLEHAEAADEQRAVRAALSGWADRGPPENI